MNIQSKQYFRIMLGRAHSFATECFDGGFIGADFGINQDLTDELPENWREFNSKFIPIYIQNHPDKSKIAAGLACGAIHTISKAINIGDIILGPTGQGTYRIGEVTGGYSYSDGANLQHQRNVSWSNQYINRDEMSESLRNSSGSIGTVSNLTSYANEIESLIDGNVLTSLSSSDESVEDPTYFALEKHLEDFLIANWSRTRLGEKYQIYSEEGEIVGQQYPSDTGPIDILAISNDGNEILVVELKKGRASDSVVGQIQRYMGYVKDVLAEDNQTVSGVIIAAEDDQRIRRALSVTQNISFMKYSVKFELNDG